MSMHRCRTLQLCTGEKKAVAHDGLPSEIKASLQVPVLPLRDTHYEKASTQNDANHHQSVHIAKAIGSPLTSLLQGLRSNLVNDGNSC